jgi:hypothetical protein
MNIFKEILKPNLALVENFILPIYSLTNIGHMKTIAGLQFVKFSNFMDIKLQVKNQRHLKKYLMYWNI